VGVGGGVEVRLTETNMAVLRTFYSHHDAELSIKMPSTLVIAVWNTFMNDLWNYLHCMVCCIAAVARIVTFVYFFVTTREFCSITLQYPWYLYHTLSRVCTHTYIEPHSASHPCILGWITWQMVRIVSCSLISLIFRSQRDIFFQYQSMASRDSVVGLATGYRLDDREVGARVPVGSRIFSSPCLPGRLWGPHSFLYNGYRE
jgi:hypothetical protein